MLRCVKDLYGYTLHATDGDVGLVHEFLFDDETWVIRYLVCGTGIWLPGRRVLISPVALGRPHYETRMFPVMLTKEQVRNSPDIDTDKPVSRQHEVALHAYYGWPIYWSKVAPAGVDTVALPPPAMAVVDAVEGQEGDPHLQSTQEVIGYYIRARDGDIGHVDDFIVDDETWTIRYMIVDTRNWFPGKKVLVSPQWITEVSWGEAKVYVDMTGADIKKGPEFDSTAPVNREYEERLYDFYGRPKYWI